MDHHDHVRLLEGEPGLRQKIGQPLRATGGTWADLGAGTGAFTLALADLLGPGAAIYALDRDENALRSLSQSMAQRFPETRLQTQAADFTRPLELPPLDGIVMANSLHFVTHPRKLALLKRLQQCLRPGGQFVLVEYDADRGNLWVPHPFSFPTWQKMAAEAGYPQTIRLAVQPSRFLGAIYSAVSWVDPDGRGYQPD